MGASTICTIVKEVIKLIWNNLYAVHMPMPTEKRFIEIVKNFFLKTGFPHCIGALDVKHVRIKCPPHSGSKYFNWKKFYSVALQAVVDSDGKFIFIEVGAPGKRHDSHTFRSSNLYKKIVSKQLNVPKGIPLPFSNVITPFVLIADGAYPISQYLLKPYRGKNLTTKKNF